mgnify:CR=1 FL=1
MMCFQKIGSGRSYFLELEKHKTFHIFDTFDEQNHLLKILEILIRKPYLLLLAQPPRRTPYTAILESAKTQRTPTSSPGATRNGTGSGRPGILSGGSTLPKGIAAKIANDAVQIYGGYGFTKEFPVEKFYRDAKLCTIGEGTSEIQKLVISRQILN